jgi:integrase
MKAVGEDLYVRGNHSALYLHKRIPADLQWAYPKRTHITKSLGTTDLKVGKARRNAMLVEIQAEFDQKRSSRDLSRLSLNPKRVKRLTDAELKSVADFWLRQALVADEHRRAQGLSDEEFDALDDTLTEQRKALGRLMAKGQPLALFPALSAFMHLCGLTFEPESDEEARRACNAFLKTVVDGLDIQLIRQGGGRRETQDVVSNTAHPFNAVFPPTSKADGPTWEKMFETWRDVVVDRPLSTTLASQTPWRDVRLFAEGRGIKGPTQLTPELLADWVQEMKERGLAVKTINERILKVRAIFTECRKRPNLGVKTNPALETAGFKESRAKQRKKRRMPFDAGDLQKLFSSEIFTQHKRSKGQSGEASYWIPVLMYYSGARPEELAGLPLSDIIHDPQTDWWYFNLQDTGLDEGDVDLFEKSEKSENSEKAKQTEEAEVPRTHSRTLKNAASVRKVPVARELIELGLFRYVTWLREQGHTMLFPTLKKDFHGKLSGAFSKFFGRYKRHLGITDTRKVLYSFRHTMKDFLEAARCPSKYLQRVLGHTTGDGAVTDGYGSDLPFEIIVEYFEKVTFPPIPAAPWQPGKGFITLKEQE